MGNEAQVDRHMGMPHMGMPHMGMPQGTRGVLECVGVCWSVLGMPLVDRHKGCVGVCWSVLECVGYAFSR